MDRKTMMGLVAGGIGLGTLAGLVAARAVAQRKVATVSDSLVTRPSGEVFSEQLIAGLPAPVQRYFLNAIRPGTPLALSARGRMVGQIKPGGNTWLPFTASMMIAPHKGFLWRVRAARGPISLSGADYYNNGEGRTRIALWGLVPVLNAAGPDIARSARGRLMSESIFVPSALLPQRGVTWEAADDRHISASWPVDGERATLALTLGEGGEVREAVIQRYGNVTPTREFAYIPFGARMERQQTFGGHTIPAQFRAGWWYGTDSYDEFFRATVIDVQYS